MSNHYYPCMTWRELAACRGADPELWFPDEDATVKVRAAIAVCTSCPVRAACLEENVGERFGVWGGLSEVDRRVLRRQRRVA